MTLVIPRLIGAVAGFIERYGALPTRALVPAENLALYRADRNSVPAHYNNEIALALLDRIELIPVPHQLYTALDDEGRSFDYGEKNPSDDWWRTVGSMVQQVRAATQPLSRPIENSYVVPGTWLAAGEYPGSPPGTPQAESNRRLTQFIDAGITAFIDITGPADGLAPYAQDLHALAAQRGIDVSHRQLTIRDMDVCDTSQMSEVLNCVDAYLDVGRAVYVHCWGGIGRTGLVVGCWLVRHGRTGAASLSEVGSLFRTMSAAKVQRHQRLGSPQTEAQRDMVRNWAAHDQQLVRPGAERQKPNSDDPADKNMTAATTLRDRYVGAMLGLATGDALGTTLEFRAPGMFKPIDDIVGGGPFGLSPGQWTDDTSMALCLAHSLIECNGFDPVDQMRRYVRWIDEGYWSSTGRCFDVGGVVSRAISAFRSTGNGFSGPTGEQTAGNGSLMRLAPVPLFFAIDAQRAITMAADSSRTTHGTAAAVDACRYFAALLLGALAGATKEELIAPAFAPVPGLWEQEPLHPAIAAVASGSFRTKAPPEIRGGSGYVGDTLEAALWAFATTADFASGALAAVNLGGDADTTGAVYGQIAGAYYGVNGIPAHWRAIVTNADKISWIAEQLYDAAQA